MTSTWIQGIKLRIYIACYPYMSWVEKYDMNNSCSVNNFSYSFWKKIKYERCYVLLNRVMNLNDSIVFNNYIVHIAIMSSSLGA